MLLNLIENPAMNSNISVYYLGWDRTSSPATSGACIHHPMNSQKKISATNNTISSYPISIIWDKGASTTPPNTHWKVTFTNGAVEKGSSGSPLLNQNKYVIGQTHGGPRACPPDNAIQYYGRFDLSWNGDGTSSTRLKDWLDPCGINPTILDGKDSRPAIISGPEAAFTSTTCSASYTVSNLPPNITNAYWTASGGLLLVTDNGTAGCTVTRASNSTANYGYVNFHYTDCAGQSKTVSKQVIARLTPIFYIYKGNFAQNWNGLTAGDEVYFYSQTEPASAVSNYSWALKTPQSSSMTQSLISPEIDPPIISDRPQIDTTMVAPSPCPTGIGTLLFTGRNTGNQKTVLVAGTNRLSLTVTDGCGTTQACKQFTV
jgi:hypothetical protein